MSYLLSCVLIFLFSFCSLAYELLLAKLMTDLTQNETLSQCLGVGVFLLGLGFGAGLCSGLSIKKPLKRLLHLELSLTALVFLMGTAAYLTGFLFLLPSEPHFADSFAGQWGVYLFISFLIFIVGVLSGFELPLMLQSQEEKGRIHLALGISYLGGLVSGIAVPFLFAPIWGSVESLYLLGLLNLVLCGILLIYIESGSRSKLLHLSLMLIPTMSLYVGVVSFHSVEQMYLKVFYHRIKIPAVSISALQNLKATLAEVPAIERYHSHYQKIDIVRGSAKSTWVMDPSDGVQVYLDRRLQFAENNFSLYHESMVQGGFNLAKRVPRNVLILGGGDGLLATELLKYPEVESIVLVELDPKMIELSNRHPDFVKLNQKSLQDPRVKIVVTDAFSYMKNLSLGSVDAILIDFPYPYSTDLLRLYSVEFYQIIKRALAPQGFAVLDIPIYSQEEWGERNQGILPQWIIRDTLYEAGFESVFAFGVFEGFAFVTSQKKELAFDYKNMPTRLATPSVINLKDINHLLVEPENKHKRVNSIFKPYEIMSLKN